MTAGQWAGIALLAAIAVMVLAASLWGEWWDGQ